MAEGGTPGEPSCFKAGVPSSLVPWVIELFYLPSVYNASVVSLMPGACGHVLICTADLLLVQKINI